MPFLLPLLLKSFVPSTRPNKCQRHPSHHAAHMPSSAISHQLIRPLVANEPFVSAALFTYLKLAHFPAIPMAVDAAFPLQRPPGQCSVVPRP